MEGMQNAASAMGAPAPAAASTPSPNYVPPPPPTPAPMPEMAKGGETNSYAGGGSIKEFFSDINVVEVVLSAFIVAGVIYSVYYNKYMMKLEKTGYEDVTDRIMKLESSMAAKEAEMNAVGNMKKRKSPLMRLG